MRGRRTRAGAALGRPLRASDVRLMELKERLASPRSWFPYPALLSFGLVLLLTAHLVFGAASRLGHKAEVLEFPAPEAPEAAIWLSVSEQEGDIVLTTPDRRIFRWPREVKSLDEVKPLARYLEERVREETLAAVLFGQGFESQVRAVIAVDQRLRYAHVRPLIYALGEAGISRYAFETRRPEVAINADYLESGESLQ